MEDRALDLFGANGPLAAAVQGFAPRDEQIAVAQALFRVLDQDGALLCEAGTGIGKTFAYLVPALLSGRRVVISTATKALQDQIAHRDLPLVQKALGTRIDVSVMKGLSNYLCRRRYKEFLLSSDALRPSVAQDLELVGGWSRSTETGDLAELVTLGEGASVRARVASSSETRLGSRCPYYEECFVTQMKRDAEQSQIIITNHHLFFADLALRGPHPGRVLPEYDAVVLDEAHQIEDIAALFFGVRVTLAQLERLCRDAKRLVDRTETSLSARRHVTMDAARDAAHRLFGSLLGGAGRKTVRPDDWSPQTKQAYAQLDAALADLAAACGSRASAASDDIALREGLEQAVRRAESVREGLGEIVRGQAGRVTWAERVEDKASLSSTPVDLSHVLRERLFDSVPAVALLSATLSTRARPGQGGFDYMRGRLGLVESPGVEELRVLSPFDYERQCLLYLPGDIGEPKNPGFLEAAAQRCVELIELTDGGAFVLTTSLSSMRDLHQRLTAAMPKRRVWIQGERPKQALLSAFRAHESAVLVATTSFWEGVDVPGHALRLVILEKLPFAVPTDPVVQARGEALERVGKSSFAHLAVPQAAINLKQGFGRLIRTKSDRGVVALLDGRATTKAYGKRLLSALPPARRTSDWQEVVRFANQRE